MSSPRLSRRTLLRSAVAATGAAALRGAPAIAQGAAARVVVIGGGFGGASCARALKRLEPKLAVTLVAGGTTFTACPLSNSVLAGSRDLKAQQFAYDRIAADGVTVVPETAAAVDPQARTVALRDGRSLAYDRLVMAPGIDFRWDALPGYDEAAAQRMPHAWEGGAQTALLRRQIEAMDDGGLVAIAVPVNPFRCPPGPYERASLIAYYLKRHKPRSKIVILDSHDSFSKQRLFQNAWKDLYGDMIEWVSLSSGGKVTSVDPKANTLTTDFETFKAKVANVIPPQTAAAITVSAGVADRTRWCPINPATFTSTLQPEIHVIGDAAISGAMPKSAFSANAQAKACAAVIVQMLAGASPPEPKLINTCYSLAAPDYGFSIAGVYRPGNGIFVEVPGAGGVSPTNAPAAVRKAEAEFAHGWFNTTTSEIFG